MLFVDIAKPVFELDIEGIRKLINPNYMETMSRIRWGEMRWYLFGFFPLDFV